MDESTSPFLVRPIRRTDFSTLADFTVEWSLGDETCQIFNRYLHSYPGSLRRVLVRGLRKSIVKPNTVVMVVEEETTGSVIAYSTWHVSGANAISKVWTNRNTSWGSRFESMLVRIEGQYASRFASPHFLQSDRTDYEKRQEGYPDVRDEFKDSGYIELDSLVVDGPWRMKGVASLLMKYGIDVAAKADLPVVVNSGHTSVGFYERVGFVKRATMPVNASGSVTQADLVLMPHQEQQH